MKSFAYIIAFGLGFVTLLTLIFTELYVNMGSFSPSPAPLICAIENSDNPSEIARNIAKIQRLENIDQHYALNPLQIYHTQCSDTSKDVAIIQFNNSDFRELLFGETDTTPLHKYCKDYQSDVSTLYANLNALEKEFNLLNEESVQSLNRLLAHNTKEAQLNKIYLVCIYKDEKIVISENCPSQLDNMAFMGLIFNQKLFQIYSDGKLYYYNTVTP